MRLDRKLLFDDQAAPIIGVVCHPAQLVARGQAVAMRVVGVRLVIAERIGRSQDAAELVVLEPGGRAFALDRLELAELRIGIVGDIAAGIGRLFDLTESIVSVVRLRAARIGDAGGFAERIVDVAGDPVTGIRHRRDLAGLVIGESGNLFARILRRQAVTQPVIRMVGVRRLRIAMGGKHAGQIAGIVVEIGRAALIGCSKGTICIGAQAVGVPVPHGSDTFAVIRGVMAARLIVGVADIRPCSAYGRIDLRDVHRVRDGDRIVPGDDPGVAASGVVIVAAHIAFGIGRKAKLSRCGIEIAADARVAARADLDFRKAATAVVGVGRHNAGGIGAGRELPGGCVSERCLPVVRRVRDGRDLRLYVVVSVIAGRDRRAVRDGFAHQTDRMPFGPDPVDILGNLALTVHRETQLPLPVIDVVRRAVVGVRRAGRRPELTEGAARPV